MPPGLSFGVGAGTPKYRGAKLQLPFMKEKRKGITYTKPLNNKLFEKNRFNHGTYLMQKVMNQHGR